MEYETPLWTLIGVAVGFVLSYSYNQFRQRREYKEEIRLTIERIKRSMHLSNSRQGIQRIADLIPQFKEREQVEILTEVGLESSLNADCEDVTQCVIDELAWISIIYQVGLEDRHLLPKKSRKDQKRVSSIQNALWHISHNSVEYTQSEKLLQSTLQLLNVFNNYAIGQGYEEIIGSSIELYRSMGLLSLGAGYDPDIKGINFQSGVTESIKRLLSLRQSLCQSCALEKSKISELSVAIDNAIETIRKQQSEKTS